MTFETGMLNEMSAETMMNDAGKNDLTARGAGRVMLNIKVYWLNERRSAG